MKQLLLFVFSALSVASAAQSEIVSGENQLTLKNAYIERSLVWDENGFYTTDNLNKMTPKPYNYGHYDSKEFAFDVDGQTVRGNDGSFTYQWHEVSEMEGYKQLQVMLNGNDATAAEGLSVLLTYYLYDKYPAVRKKLAITNESGRDVAITNLQVEKLCIAPKGSFFSEVFHNFGSSYTRIPYIGYHNDPALLVWSYKADIGLILGNEALGVMKRTDVYTKHQEISTGLTRIDDPYPFKKWLGNVETFHSPHVFTYLIADSVWQNAYEGKYKNFVREHLGLLIYEVEDPPLYYYCSWHPWASDISHEKLAPVVDIVAQSGADVFLIDEGWENNLGDWGSHPERFPDGVEKTCEYIREKGMIPGMWFSMATVHKACQAYQEHPEWAITDKNGNHINLHQLNSKWDGRELVTMSMGSPWRYYNLDLISKRIESCGLGYVKIDFATMLSCYVHDYEYSGDYSYESKNYRDHESSYYAIVEGMMEFCDSLRARHPGLIIDITYEVMGRSNLIDYGQLQHCHLNWVSNMDGMSLEGLTYIRRTNQKRGRVVPPAAMLTGNPNYANPDLMLAYQTISTSLPVFLGDARVLDQEQKKSIKAWSEWYAEMNKKYNYYHYHQYSDIFSEPGLRTWDGVYKVNPEAGGGILFFFRNDSPDETSRFHIPASLIDAGSVYTITRPLPKEKTWTYSGKELIEKGVEIKIGEAWGWEVLGIEKQD